MQILSQTKKRALFDNFTKLWQRANGYVSMGMRILGIQAKNGSENGSEGYSEALESIPMVSDSSDFWQFCTRL